MVSTAVVACYCDGRTGWDGFSMLGQGKGPRAGIGFASPIPGDAARRETPEDCIVEKEGTEANFG